MGSRLILAVGGTPVDLWLAPDTELHRREFERARTIPYGNRFIRLMDPEDFVLRKVVTWRRVRRKSTGIDDAYQILLVAWYSIDRARLLDRAGFHRVTDAMRELIEVAEEDRKAAGV